MSSEFSDSAATFFDRRFFLAYWYPTLLSFSTGLLIYSWPLDWKPLDLYFSASQNGIPGSQPSFNLQIILVTLLLTLVIAHLLQAFSHPLVQVWEGYWPKLLWNWYKDKKGVEDRWDELKRERKNAQERIKTSEDPDLFTTDQDYALRKEIEFRQKYACLQEKLFYEYPSQKDQLLPTQLGNVLRAAEDYSQSKYGMDIVFWWPRLWLILPEAVQQQLNDSETPMLSLLNLATQLVVISLIGFIYLCVQYTGPWKFFAFFAAFITLIVGITLTTFAYHGAVTHAKVYGTLIRSIVDTYRFDLLGTLRQPMPLNLHEEKKLWRNLMRWAYLNEQEPIPWYTHDKGRT